MTLKNFFKKRKQEIEQVALVKLEHIDIPASSTIFFFNQEQAEYFGYIVEVASYVKTMYEDNSGWRYFFVAPDQVFVLKGEE